MKCLCLLICLLICCLSLSPPRCSMRVKASLQGSERPLQMSIVETESFSAHSGAISALDASSDETLLATGSGDSTIRIWRRSSNEHRRPTCARTYNGHRGTVLSLDLLRGATRVASCDGSLHIWDIEVSLVSSCLFLSLRHSNLCMCNNSIVSSIRY